MKQFLFFMFQALYTIFANIVDDGFANRMSVDVVIAYGSFLPIIWTFQSFYNIGKYAYTNTMKHPKTCMLLGLIVDVIVIILLLPVYKYIHIIYSLSDIQINIFNNLLLIYLITTPLRQLGDFLNLYLMYKMRNKQIIVSDIIFWCVNISIDLVVYIKGMPAWYLMAATAVGYLLYDGYLLYVSNILKDKIEWSFMKEAFQKGFDIVMDRIAGKVATLVYGSLASRLPEQSYAIHCIVYGVICNCEEFTNNFNIYCRARLNNLSKNIKKGCYILLKKYTILLVSIIYISSMGFLFIYHGKIPYMDCLPWLLLYMSDCLSLIFYESFKAVLSCYSRTDYLRYGGLFGILARIPYTYMMYKLGFGLLGFGTACTLDFAIRAIYFYIMINKCEKNTKFNASTDIEENNYNPITIN